MACRHRHGVQRREAIPTIQEFIARRRGGRYDSGRCCKRISVRFEVNFNPLILRFFQGSESPATQLSYQSQIKYRYSQPLEVGIQAFGRLSASGQTWTPYSEQVHRVGPVVLGRLVLPRERSLSYNIAFLMGTTAHSPDRTLRFQFEYEF